MADTRKPGAYLTQAPTDWQILQQDDSGHACLELAGEWVHERADAQVEVAVLRQDTGAPVSRATDWQAATTMNADRTWSHRCRVPAGGLYRLATRLFVPGANVGDWALRGDMRHYIGVGDLWVIAGQSNSAGYGREAVDDAPALGVHMLRNNMSWMLASHPMNDSTATAHPANSEGANPGHSPYLIFAKRLQRELGYPIGLVQTSLGGSPLSAWNPRENPDAPLYAIMRDCVAASGGRVAGILWYQGESDCGPEQSVTYLERFGQALDAWREVCGGPVPILTVQLNRVTNPPDNNHEADTGWSRIREAQRQAARVLKRVAVVPTTDLPLSDQIHVSSAGNLVLGDRLASAALGMVHGHDIPWRAPDLELAEWRAAEQILRLRFDHVVSRIERINHQSTPFQVSDDAGDIPVATITCHSRNYVDLTLARPPVSRLHITAAHGRNPSALPLDISRIYPLLAFHEIHVDV